MLLFWFSTLFLEENSQRHCLSSLFNMFSYMRFNICTSLFAVLSVLLVMLSLLLFPLSSSLHQAAAGRPPGGEPGREHHASVRSDRGGADTHPALVGSWGRSGAQQECGAARHAHHPGHHSAGRRALQLPGLQQRRQPSQENHQHPSQR